jgi:hypothetical protein
MRLRYVRLKLVDFSPSARRYLDRRLRAFHRTGRWPDDAAELRRVLHRMALLGPEYVERVPCDERGPVDHGLRREVG